MAQDAIHLLTPIGRLVRGSLTERQKTDYDGNPYEEGKGPFELGFAVRKDDPGINDLLGKIYQHAHAGYGANPTIQQRMLAEYQSGFAMGTFRFKIRDGDKPNQEGRVNENTVGHWVFNLSSYIAFKATYVTGYGLPKFKNASGVDIEPMTEIQPSLIKIGDYCHINIGVKTNDKTDHTAGLYMNVNAVILGAYGNAITGGIDLATATAGLVIGALPVGASVAPVSGGGAPAALPNPTGGAPVAAAPVMAAPAPVQAAPGLPAPATASPSNVAPHTQFLQGPGAVGGGAPVGLPIPGQTA
jgi:hypothetical protein